VLRRRVLLAAAAAFVLLLVLACSPARLFSRTSAGRYAQDMASAIEDLAAWVGKVQKAASQVSEAKSAQEACQQGKLEALASEGEAIVRRMQEANPPQAISSAHKQLVEAASGLVEQVKKAEALLCQGKLEDGLEALQEAKEAQDQLAPLLEALKQFLAKR
jgi:hypothetical protein